MKHTRLWLQLAASISLLLVVSAGTARAQLGVYASVDAAKLNVPHTNWIYGPSFGAYLDHGHFGFLSAGLDLRGEILAGSGATRFDAGYLGPRVAFRPHIVPIKPYVEALAGAGYAQFGQGTAQAGATRFSYQLIGGVDYTLLPRIDWRVAEFSYGGLSILDGTLNPKVLSTGIVIRLPGVF